MRVLQAGHQATKRAAEDKQKGVKPQHRDNLNDFDQRLKQGDFNDTDIPKKGSASF